MISRLTLRRKVKLSESLTDRGRRFRRWVRLHLVRSRMLL